MATPELFIDQNGIRYDITGANLPLLKIGRAYKNNVVIPPASSRMRETGMLREYISVSAFHATFDPLTKVLRDNGSSNGTWADGKKLADGEGIALKDGSRIRLGELELTYSFGYKKEA